MTLKQMTKDERLNPWKPKSHANQRKILWCVCPFSSSTKLFRVICRSCKYFYQFHPHETFIGFA